MILIELIPELLQSEITTNNLKHDEKELLVNQI